MSAAVAALLVGDLDCGFGSGGLGPGVDEGNGADAAGAQESGAGDAVGNGDAAGTTDSPPSGDAATTGDAPSASDGSACLASLPGGWSVSQVEQAATAPCPDGTAAAIGIVSPTPGPGACTCGCAVTPAPTCQWGNVVTKVDFSNCTNNGVTVAGDGSCTSFNGGPLAGTAAAFAEPPQGGACTSSTHTDPTAIVGTKVGVCPASAAQAESVCSGMSAVGFAACIVHDGMLSCPVGPFVHASVAYDDPPMVVCSPCGACTFQATCSGIVTAYSDTQCQTPVESLPADGVCYAMNRAGSFVQSADYSATAMTGCTPGTSAASLVTSGPRTICCR